MSTERQNLKLELTWVGKDSRRPQLEPRILLPDPALSYAARKTEHDLFDNQLIFGDNLLALQSLATDPNVRGQVKCIFIDPPYNTGSAFEHYDDGMEHSLWLGMMRERLELLRELLSEDGSIWISIDDNEAHYLKVLCDEIFGRRNFVASFMWRKVDSPNDNKVAVTPDHEHVFSYARSKSSIKFSRKSDPQIVNAFGSIDGDGRRYRDRLLKKNGRNSRAQDRPTMYFPVPTPDGTEVWPKHDDGSPARWAAGHVFIFELLEKNEIIWKRRVVANEETWVPYTREYAPDNPERPWPTIWSDLTTMRQAKAHQKTFFTDGQTFETPKPEELVERIFLIATNPGDLVLDSFAGSGTTGAVAHKMNRRWIMIELGEHAHTHIIPRLRKVIDGTDQGGISKALNWQGGGGFKYSRLASSVLKKDKWDQYVINPQYNAEMLAEACCKVHGFVYAPSQNQQFYWMHGRSTEADFIYVTTNYLSHGQALEISEEVGPQRTLLILTTAYDTQAENLPNLTLKKIPQSMLNRCDWDHDDYSLRVENLPHAEPPEERVEAVLVGSAGKSGARGRRTQTGREAPGLFDAPQPEARPGGTELEGAGTEA